MSHFAVMNPIVRNVVIVCLLLDSCVNLVSYLWRFLYSFLLIMCLLIIFLSHRVSLFGNLAFFCECARKTDGEPMTIRPCKYTPTLFLRLLYIQKIFCHLPNLFLSLVLFCLHKKFLKQPWMSTCGNKLVCVAFVCVCVFCFFL